MSDIKDGGPAFPQPVSCTSMGDLLHTEIPGVSILDYFAAKAMQAMITKSSGQDTTGGSNGVPVVAKYSYEYAAAMLQARGKIINEKV